MKTPSPDTEKEERKKNKQGNGQHRNENGNDRGKGKGGNCNGNCDNGCSGNCGGKCGGKVKINHSGTFISPYTGEEVKLKTVYCHLSEVSVTEGATVKKGDKIGKTGGAASKIDGSRKQKNANGEIVDADNAARISSEYYREAGAGKIL